MANLELVRKSEPDFVCDFCGYNCNEEALYDEHLQSHIVSCCTASSDFIREELNDNNICGNGQNAVTELDEPRRLDESVVKQYGCTAVRQNETREGCSALGCFSSVAHVNTDAYNCSVCGYGFPTEVTYQKHVRAHVQKIDAALNRQVTPTKIVPVTLIPRDGQLPLVKFSNLSPAEVKPQASDASKKLIVDESPTQKAYNDKLSDTVEALRLSLSKSSVPGAPASTSSHTDSCSRSVLKKLPITDSEVLGARPDGDASAKSRKRKQALIHRDVLATWVKSDVNCGKAGTILINHSHCASERSESESDVEEPKEAPVRWSANQEKDRIRDSIRNGYESQHSESSGSKDDENCTGDDKNIYKLLKEHSYPASLTKTSPQMCHQSVSPAKVAPLRPAHVPASKGFECNICGNQYSALNNLNRHLKTHRKQKRRRVDSPTAARGGTIAPSSKREKMLVENPPQNVAKAFGTDMNSKSLNSVQPLGFSNKPKSREPPESKAPSLSPSNVQQHWVSKKAPQNQQRSSSAFLNIKCFCGRKFTTVPSFRKHMQCHVHGPSRTNQLNDGDPAKPETEDPVESVYNVLRDDLAKKTPPSLTHRGPEAPYDSEDTVESVYNMLRNDLGNSSLPSFVTEKAPSLPPFVKEKAPRPKVSPDRIKFQCPQCSAGFTSLRYMSNHMGSKRCEANMRQNWQAYRKTSDGSKLSHCSDCGATMPSYAPKVLARHVTNAQDNIVKCRFCVLKADRLRIAASKKGISESVDKCTTQEVKEDHLSVSESCNVVDNSKLEAETNNGNQERPSSEGNPKTLKLLSRERKSLVQAPVSSDALEKTPATSSNCGPNGINICEKLPTDKIIRVNAQQPSATLNNCVTDDVASGIQRVPSVSSLTAASARSVLVAADAVGIAEELKKQYMCDRCGLVYLSEWSYSRHRQKFCAPKPSSVAAGSSTEHSSQQNVAASTELPKSGGLAELTREDDESDVVVEDDEDKMSIHSTVSSLIGIDLGESSDDELLLKDDSSDENKNSDDDSDSDLYDCNFCNTRSTSPLSYKEHLQTHVSIVVDTDEHKLFYCEKCACRTLNILHKCRTESETPKSSTCGICLRQFQSMESAQMHALKCHDSTELVFCLGCHWGLGSTEELKEHVSECEGCVIKNSTLNQLGTSRQSPVHRLEVDDEASDTEVLSKNPVVNSDSISSPKCIVLENNVDSDVETVKDSSHLNYFSQNGGLRDDADFGATVPLISFGDELLSPCSPSTEIKSMSSGSSSPLPEVRFLRKSIRNLVQVKNSSPSTAASLDGLQNLNQSRSSPPVQQLSSSQEKVSPRSNLPLEGVGKTHLSPKSDCSNLTENTRPSAASNFCGDMSVMHSSSLELPSASQKNRSATPLRLETLELRKPLSYAEVLGLRPASPILLDSNSISETRQPQSPSVDLSSLSSIHPSAKLPHGSRPASKLQATSDKSFLNQSLELDNDDLDFTCYSPEMASSPTECSYIQSEIDEIIGKLPALHSEVSQELDAHSGDVDCGSRSPLTTTHTAGSNSPNTGVVSRPANEAVGKTSPVHRALPLRIVVSPVSSPDEKATQDGPIGTASLLMRKRKLPEKITSPSECSNPTISLLTRKPKLTIISPGSLRGKTAFNSGCDVPLKVRDLTKPAELTSLAGSPLGNRPNGLKLKLVRITTPKKKGKSLLKNGVSYKLVSEQQATSAISQLSRCELPTPQLPSTDNSTIAPLTGVQGEAIDSTIRNRAFVCETSCAAKERRPVLEHLFSEIRSSAVTDDGAASASSSCMSVGNTDVHELQQRQTSPVDKLTFAYKPVFKRTARKSIRGGSMLHTRQSLRSRQSLIDSVSNAGVEFTDINGVRHILRKCTVQVHKLEESKSLAQSVSNAKKDLEDVRTQFGEPVDKVIKAVKEDEPILGQHRSPPKFAINKILSSIKRFIKPTEPQPEHKSNDASLTDSCTPIHVTPAATQPVDADINEAESEKLLVVSVPPAPNHVSRKPSKNATSVFNVSPVRPASPALSADAIPVFRHRACKTYTRTPLKRVLIPSQSLPSASPPRAESLTLPVDSSVKSVSTTARNVNKILSAFRTLIDHRDSAHPSKTTP